MLPGFVHLPEPTHSLLSGPRASAEIAAGTAMVAWGVSDSEAMIVVLKLAEFVAPGGARWIAIWRLSTASSWALLVICSSVASPQGTSAGVISLFLPHLSLAAR